MFHWPDIHTALIDMDGVLLDLGFDNEFWQRTVPAHYARQAGLDEDTARTRLDALYQAQEGSLNWTDLDYWARELGLDIVAMKREEAHKVSEHAHARCFLDALGRRGIRRVLVTNAHPDTLAIKLGQTGISALLDRVVCAYDIGLGKESERFWPRLQETLGFDPERTLLVEDSARNLAAARAFGIRHLCHIARPSTRGPLAHHPDYPSVAALSDLIAELAAAPAAADQSPRNGTACECTRPAPGAPPR